LYTKLIGIYEDISIEEKNELPFDVIYIHFNKIINNLSYVSGIKDITLNNILEYNIYESQLKTIHFRIFLRYDYPIMYEKNKKLVGNEFLIAAYLFIKDEIKKIIINDKMIN
jgi:hypothetical protein